MVFSPVHWAVLACLQEYCIAVPLTVCEFPISINNKMHSSVGAYYMEGLEDDDFK